MVDKDGITTRLLKEHGIKCMTEEEYLKASVYGNKISSVYGLLIQKGDEEPYGVDVSSDIIVLACNTITKKDSISGEITHYQYDKNGNYTIIEETPKVKEKTMNETTGN